ncbi:MAG TPA: hypothetical protein VKB93_03405 [Thermoanaerobaculia bacterium]|nr:hypothetical protein [Thermoanaerobaculia bacterium]
MILALVAMLAIAGSAFGAGRMGSVELQPNATFSNGNNPTTTNNDDSCDTTNMPAATLLLPFFDVNITATAGSSDTTLFTITNVSSSPQIAHVTVWTDWSFPVLDFNIFLTGYDVQSINLYDVIARGVVAPGGPGTSSTNFGISPNVSETGVGFVATTGSAPDFNDANPNFSGAGNCSGTQLPGQLSAELTAAVQTALTTGLYNVAGSNPFIGCGTSRIGGTHSNARGYVTIDVANNCSISLPTSPTYFTTEILFDNVLIGDYQQINGDPTVGNLAQGNPLVHIKAIPEGGPAGVVATNLPYTFYDRYTPAATRRVDRRVPLPATFAARWIEGGTSSFQTNYKIWREGLITGASCSATINNSVLPYAEVIRFDERENSFALGGGVRCSPTCGPGAPVLPESSITSTANTSFYPPHAGSPDISGWMYLNLNNPNATGYSFNGVTGIRPSQNWVIVSMFAQGRYSVDFDAAQLGNGCSATVVAPSPEIGPAGGIFVCPPTIVCVAPVGTHPYSGTNTTP